MTIYSDILLSFLEPVCCSTSSSNSCFSICIQISQEAGQVVWCSHLFKNFPQFALIHTVKGFSIVNEAEVRCFSGTLLLFLQSNGLGNLISCSSAFTKFSLNIWKFSVHILLKRSLKDFEHYLASVYQHWSDCEEIPHIQGQRRSPNKMGGGAKSCLESNLPEMLGGLK